MIQNMMKHTADISRLVRDGHATERQTVHENIPCLLIPSSAETASAGNIELSRSFDLFLNDGVDIDVSDKVTVDSIDYYIKGVKRYRGVGSASHVQCICEIADVKDR